MREIEQFLRPFELGVCSFFVVTLWNKTNNLIIMKRDKVVLDRLTLDVAYYTFAGWLIRNNYYSKFMANFSGNADSDNPREAVRSYLSMLLRSNSMSLRGAFSSAFLFLYTPEGADFWYSVERKWADYLDKLSAKF